MEQLTERVLAAMDRHDRPALRLAAAVREHVVFHGIHRREAFVTDSEIRALSPNAAPALIAKRDDYQDDLRRDDPRRDRATARCAAPTRASRPTRSCCSAPGSRCGSTPTARSTSTSVAELHVELVLGSVGASRELISGGDRASA